MEGCCEKKRTQLYCFLKPATRWVHFTSLGMMAGHLALAWNNTQSYDRMEMWARQLGHYGGLGILGSGVLSWWLLKSFKTEENKTQFRIWTALLHSKGLILALLFSPLARKVVNDDEKLTVIRVAIFGLFALISPFVRALREKVQCK